MPVENWEKIELQWDQRTSSLRALLAGVTIPNPRFSSAIGAASVDGQLISPSAISAPAGAASLFQSIFNFERTVADAANLLEGAAYVKMTKTAGANPTAGHFAMGAEVAINGGSVDHWATFYAHYQGLGTLFNTGFGHQAHMWASTAGQQLVGIAGHMELNNATSNAGTVLYGADLYTGIILGAAAGATGIALRAAVHGAGWAAASHNAIFGEGLAFGENYPVSFRGYSSRTANAGEAKMNLTIIDLGAGGAAAFWDATDVRLLVGEIHKLADQSLASFIIQDSAGGTLMNVNAGGKTTLKASAAGAASLNLPHGAAPSAPANGDIWTTTAGLFVRVNGATVGPLT